jgi:hypothetical protein
VYFYLLETNIADNGMMYDVNDKKNKKDGLLGGNMSLLKQQHF